jgi:hypothetical protein
MKNRIVFFCIFLFWPFFLLKGELRYADDIRASPERLKRIADAVALIEKYESESPLLRWSRKQDDPLYQGDIKIICSRLTNDTLGQWDGAEIIIDNATLDDDSILQLALILYHEAAHADHHYHDREAVVINRYASFLSPRQYLLFQMLNEGMAVYKEVTFRLAIGINTESKNKRGEKPPIAFYEEDFYEYYKDLLRWMKGNPEYNKLERPRFEEALYREFLEGFITDPWYLDYYLSSQEYHYAILRGRDFAVCPSDGNPAYAIFAAASSTVLSRYIEKNSPAGLGAIDAGTLEGALKKILETWDGEDKNFMEKIKTHYASQKNFETLSARIAELPAGIELYYDYNFSAEVIDGFKKLLENLEKGPGE